MIFTDLSNDLHVSYTLSVNTLNKSYDIYITDDSTRIAICDICSFDYDLYLAIVKLLSYHVQLNITNYRSSNKDNKFMYKVQDNRSIYKIQGNVLNARFILNVVYQ